MLEKIKRLYQKGHFEDALKELKKIPIEKREKEWYELFTKASVKLERWSDAKKALLYGYKNIDKVAFSELGNALLESYKKGVLNRMRKLCNDINKKYNGRIFLIVGSMFHYADGLIKLLRRCGLVPIVIKASAMGSFKQNYNLLRSMNVKLLSPSEVPDYVKRYSKDILFVFRTGCFLGGHDIRYSSGVADIDQIDAFFKITEILKKWNKDAITILAFDGDLFLNSEEWNEWLKKRLKNVDYILVDTNNLGYYMNFYLGVRNYKVIRVEVPDVEDVYIKILPNYDRKVLLLGRWFGGPSPVSKLSIIYLSKSGLNFQLGVGEDYQKINTDRRRFSLEYGKVAFGLGYFYDFYLRGKREEGIEELLFKSECPHYQIPSLQFYYYPLTYGLTNMAGKITTYLQFGLIPLIPNDRNDYHMEMIRRNMAIGIDRNQLFFNPLEYSDYTITWYKVNIGMNLDVFTIVKFAEFIHDLLIKEE